MTTALACGLAALAAVAWLPARPRVRTPGTVREPRAASGRSGRILPVVVLLALVVLAVAMAGGAAARLVALVTILAGAGAGLWALARKGARRRRAVRDGDRVREACETLAAELAVGLPPGVALEHAAASWPHLAPVAQACAWGGDVPAAWRHAASAPGTRDLRLLAAAWEVAHRTGDGLAAAIARVAGELRRGAATRRVVAAELASARATARLLAGLPLVALAMGAGVGGNPVAFLLSEGLGLACLAAGLALGLAGLWWIEAIADGVAAEAT